MNDDIETKREAIPTTPPEASSGIRNRGEFHTAMKDGLIRLREILKNEEKRNPLQVAALLGGHFMMVVKAIFQNQPELVELFTDEDLKMFDPSLITEAFLHAEVDADFDLLSPAPAVSTPTKPREKKLTAIRMIARHSIMKNNEVTLPKTVEEQIQPSNSPKDNKAEAEAEAKEETAEPKGSPVSTGNGTNANDADPANQNAAPKAAPSKQPRSYAQAAGGSSPSEIPNKDLAPMSVRRASPYAQVVELNHGELGVNIIRNRKGRLVAIDKFDGNAMVGHDTHGHEVHISPTPSYVDECGLVWHGFTAKFGPEARFSGYSRWPIMTILKECHTLEMAEKIARAVNRRIRATAEPKPTPNSTEAKPAKSTSQKVALPATVPRPSRTQEAKTPKINVLQTKISELTSMMLNLANELKDIKSSK